MFSLRFALILSLLALPLYAAEDKCAATGMPGGSSAPSCPV